MSSLADAIVEIDWDVDAPLPIIHCPITGRVVGAGYDPVTGAFPEGYEKPNWADIPTVLFHLVDEVGEIDYIHPVLKAKLDAARAELDEDDEQDDLSLLEELDSIGNRPLVFRITTYGMANGPVEGVTFIGLDLAPGASSD